MKIINVTQFPINFVREDGSEFKVEPYGKTISGRPIEKIVSYKNNITIVENEYQINRNDEETIREIYEKEGTNILIVGTTNAAKTYPNRVVSPTVAEGYEKMPARYRKYNSTKFMTK